MERPLIIAFYLPQYHPFPKNDEWWGKGFTEWTNVGKAKPLFRDHYQPKVPADLGYYDLRLPEVRVQQAELAKEAGVGGFCYWHYWFGENIQLMNEIFDDVLRLKSPDFPFCLGWANESWKAKLWKNGAGDKILIEQKYGGERDYRAHFGYALKAFRDSRYIVIDNKPVFVIHRPDEVPSEFIALWEKWAIEEGFDGINFIGNIHNNEDFEDAKKKGIKVFTIDKVNGYSYYPWYRKLRIRVSSFLKGVKIVIPYKDAIKYLWNEKEWDENVIPMLLPNWDHTPRSGRRGEVLQDSEPKYFYQHAKAVLSNVSKKDNKIVFLKSWNEWGEGNYMEPDLRYKKGYINALRRAVDEIGSNMIP